MKPLDTAVSLITLNTKCSLLNTRLSETSDNKSPNDREVINIYESKPTITLSMSSL